jgi:hypothetical protein
MLIVLVPLVWLAVTAFVVAACRLAADGDGRAHGSHVSSAAPATA